MGVSQAKLSNSSQPRYEPVVVTFNYGSINGGGHDVYEGDAPSYEALIVGTSLGGKMSAVRRFFCLLTTFDLFFTLLIWFMAAMLASDSVRGAFRKEVMMYTIQSSLFDVVMVAAIRFTLIILAYALFRLAHWWVVAFTTAGSGAFLIGKIFLFDWLHANQYVSIVLILCNFVISWGEAWFLDFRVVPYEDKASLLLARQINERTPHIPNAPVSSPEPPEEECFYSPQGSENESDDEDYVPSNYPIRENSPVRLTSEELEYKTQGEMALENALKILASDNWRTEKVDGNDIVQSKVLPPYGKVFKFVGIIHLSCCALMEELFRNYQLVSNWNPTVKKMELLQQIDDTTDIMYIIAAEGPGGIVKSRDFVNVRFCQKREETYILALISATHQSMPPQKTYIRGEQGPSAYVLTPLPNDPNHCQMQWLLNTNLKGWIPQYLIDQSIAKVMLDYVTALRSYTANLEQIT